MYIENNKYKVKFKDDPIVFIMDGMTVNTYYDFDLSYQIEYVEEIKEF